MRGKMRYIFTVLVLIIISYGVAISSEIEERRAAAKALPPLMYSVNTYWTDSELHIEFEVLTYSPKEDLTFQVELRNKNLDSKSALFKKLPSDAVFHNGYGDYVLYTGGAKQNKLKISFDINDLNQDQIDLLQPVMYLRVLVCNHNIQNEIGTVNGFSWPNKHATLYLPKIINNKLGSCNFPYDGDNQDYAQRYIKVETCSVDRFVDGVVNHYNEFDGQENPKGYGWCGHTALKAVGEYITGVNKTLNEIHNIFLSNSPGGYATDTYCTSGFNWCAKLQDLHWASKLSQYGGYNRPESVIRTIDKGTYSYDNYAYFLQKIRDGVNRNYPPIIPSAWLYSNDGHFWVITGYRDTGNAEESIIYLRDVALENPVFKKYDHKTTVKSFFDSTEHSNNSIQILYIK